MTCCAVRYCCKSLACTLINNVFALHERCAPGFDFVCSSLRSALDRRHGLPQKRYFWPRAEAAGRVRCRNQISTIKRGVDVDAKNSRGLDRDTISHESFSAVNMILQHEVGSPRILSQITQVTVSARVGSDAVQCSSSSIVFGSCMYHGYLCMGPGAAENLLVSGGG